MACLLRNAHPFHHADQIRDRAYPQLLHHRTAVKLDRLLNQSKIAGNLLVKPPGNNIGKDFAFSWG
jgi:hypothetical protein